MEPLAAAETVTFNQRWPARLLLWVSVLSCSFSSPASLPPSLVPRVRNSYTLGRTFLGLDKCNACIGTSICKKFFKEEIRFANSMASHLGLPPQDLPSYAANYSDDFKTWRPVEISRLVSKYQSEISDRRICASASAPKTCSIERILRKTGRFQKWLQAKRLTPDLVQGLPSPFLRCPSQRLLDRVVRRYAEVADAGSIFMDHFTDRDKLRLLYTLAVNAHPIILQVWLLRDLTWDHGAETLYSTLVFTRKECGMGSRSGFIHLNKIFPGAEGWPLPKYLGSCGRFLISTSTRPLQEFYHAPPEQAADLAYQLLGVLETLRNNDLNYFFYFTHVDADMFGIFDNGHLFIRNASALGVIDKQEGSQASARTGENEDIFSCLVSGCQSQLSSCDTVPEKQSLVLVCQQLLPQLLQGKFPSPVQEEIDSALSLCSKDASTDMEVLGATSQLKDILRPLRTCDPRFAYRYPDCKYNNRF